MVPTFRSQEDQSLVDAEQALKTIEADTCFWYSNQFVMRRGSGRISWKSKWKTAPAVIFQHSMPWIFRHANRGLYCPDASNRIRSVRNLVILCWYGAGESGARNISKEARSFPLMNYCRADGRVSLRALWIARPGAGRPSHAPRLCSSCMCASGRTWQMLWAGFPRNGQAVRTCRTRSGTVDSLC